MNRLAKLNFQERVSLPELETEVLGFWDDVDAFSRSITERPADKPYVFYDGPPFVTGSPHYGSILGSIAKDVVPRYWTMKGYRVERQWGWDCHGLPIENMIEKELGLNGKREIEAFGIKEFNDACRSAITEIDATWEVIIRRIGRWVDFKQSYKTMDLNYMESVWWAFKELHDKERVYAGKKVILYCPRCGTPLSNFEIAMDNSYVDVTDQGTTYKFQVAENIYLLAWSTTPWTKIGTMALAVHPDLEYQAVKQSENIYWITSTRVAAYFGEDVEILRTLSGQELADEYEKFTPHFEYLDNETSEKSYRIVVDEFVTADTGTGIVTLAVYGEDDYRVMQAHDIPLYDYVDDRGRLDQTIMNDAWAGRDIWEVSPEIDADLEARGLIFHTEDYTHSIPVCYRCSTRLYYAPLPAWFIDVQSLKPELLAQNEKINWYPDHLKYGRFAKGIESAPDWNISRSRYWGTPMPIWEGQDSDGNTLRRVIGSMEELKTWAVHPEQVANLTDIHREFVDSIEVWVDDERTIAGTRTPEVFDVWVESGSMPYASRHYPFENQEQFNESYPAQFVSEYINQTRAWFYTMHVLSVGLFGQPAVTNIHNTGVILAADGSKMSKSKKNYTDPTLLIDQSGADALRLYLMASPVTKAENLAFTDADVETLRKRVLNIWWNVFAFYQMYQPESWQPGTPEPEHIMDRWILARLTELRDEMTDSMDHYDITRSSRDLMAALDDLSTWYLRQSRNRLRANTTDEQAWNTFHHVLRTFALLAAPIVPFITEVMYQNLAPTADSVHLDAWPEAQPWANKELPAQMKIARMVVEAGHAQRRAQQLKVRQPLATATVASPVTQPHKDVLAVIQEELNVKSIEWSEGAETLTVTLDTTLTPELIEEGRARELVRQVQQLRKDAQVALDEQVHVTLPDWPEAWTQYIQDKTKAASLTQGAEAAVRKNEA